MACSLRPKMYGSVSGSSSSACSKAWPMPATLPWPKIPKQPAKACALRRRIRSTERRGPSPVPARRSGEQPPPPSLLSHESGVDGLIRPGVPHPGLIRVIGNLPGAFGARTGHHVQVVHVEPRSRHARSMPPVRDEHRISIVHLLQQLDVLARRRRRPHEAKTLLTLGAGSNLEVVDLLQLRLGFG